MLALLKTLEDCAVRIGDDPALALSPADLRSVHEVYARLESEVARPFFRVQDLAQVEAHWGEWIDWFRPLVKEVRERILPLLTNAALQDAVMSELGAGLCDARDHLAALSPDLAHTFAVAVASGLRSDSRMLAQWGRLAATPRDPELWNRREYASIGFGLAFLLTLEALERAPRDRERLRFLILKLKRMSAVSWTTTRQILATLESPCSPPPTD